MPENSKWVGSDLSRVRLHILRYQHLDSYNNHFWGFSGREGGREGGKEGGKETVWGRMLTGGKETNSAAPQWEARLLVTWL